MNDETNLIKMADSILSNEVVERHSLFQLQCFVLAKEPTIQGKLHQCLLEIKSRKKSLDAVKLEIEDQKDRIDLIDLEISEYPQKCEEGFNKKRAEIKIRSLDRQKTYIEGNLKDLEKKGREISEELQFFCSAFDQLNKRERLKPWDDPDVQMNYWSEKLKFEVNARLLLRQLPDVELMKTILCLNDDSPVKKSVVNMLKKPNEPVLTQKPV